MCRTRSPYMWNSDCRVISTSVVRSVDDDGAGRLQVGKVILLEDEENGGLKTRTFVNATFRKCA